MSSGRYFAASLLAACLFLAWGCAVRSPDRGAAAHSGPHAPVLPDAEARALCADLSPSAQGLPSWRVLAPGVKVLAAYAGKKPADGPAFVRDGLVLTWGDVARASAAFLALLPRLDADPGLLAERFVLIPLGGPTLITGYYFPKLDASLTPAPGYGHPLYAPPPGPLRALTREDIDVNGGLAGKGLEIAWAKDPVDLFFLHIQGSGILALPDGRTVYAAYAGGNGARYRAIGRIMIADGLFEPQEKSMQRIKKALRERPERIGRYLPKNPRYAYFRITDQPPAGALGAPLVALSGAASDRTFAPLGGLLLYDARLPGPDGGSERTRGLALIQDSGTMRGNHVDLFCGEGDEAAYRAGRMKGRGNVYLLALREVLDGNVPPVSGSLAQGAPQGRALP